MSLKVELTNDLSKLERQIRALEKIIPGDNRKDKKIHEEALRKLKDHKAKLINDRRNL